MIDPKAIEAAQIRTLRPHLYGPDEVMLAVALLSADEELRRVREALAAKWQPIGTAPKDRAILVFAPGREGLSDLQSVCRWHDDAGFCIDELREPTHWRPLPSPPAQEDQ